jgi:hypothetical protein
MEITVAKKCTMQRSKLELVRIVRSQVGPIGATKNTKTFIVGSGTKQPMKGSIIANAFSGSAIDKMGGSEERLVPIFEGHGSIC